MNAQRIISVPWGMRPALAVYLLPWVILPLALIIWLQVLAPFVPAAHQFIEMYDRSDPAASFALILFDVAASYGLIAYYLRRSKVGVTAIGVRSFSIWRAIWNILLVIAAFSVLIGLAYALITALSPNFNADQAQTNEFTGAPASMQTLSLMALVIIPPLVEEPVFRGFMFPAFAKKFGLVAGAIISSLLFGLAHLQPNVDVYTFLLGLLLCFLYVRIGSIIPGILLHMFNNYIAFTALSK